MASLAVVILTFNEEIHIERAIASVASVAREIFVVDSFSSDRTLELAQAHGAVVLQNAFVNQARQFQWALEHAPISADWILRLDADEVIEPDLAVEIEAKLPTLATDIVGVHLKRKHIFMDRWIRFGGRYPLNLLRIWRRGQGRVEDRWMDEHVVVWGGRTVTFAGGFADHNLNDLSYFTDKHNRYATREAVDVLRHRHGLGGQAAVAGQGRLSPEPAAKRFVKEGFYNRLPLWLGPLAYFSYRYVLQLGFLDGKPGLIYHVLQGFWYRFLVAAKIQELDAVLSPHPNAADKKATLARMTGLKLD